MERFRFSLVLLGVTHLQLVSAVGYMSTLSAMWVSTDVSVGDYSVCSLQLPRLTAVCSSQRSPIASEPPSDISFYALSGGGYFTCGLQQQTHFPICWGLNVSEEYRNVRYADLNSGGWHACAVKLGSDLVHCWGNNAFGQSQPPPYQDFWKVTAGDYFTCGLSRSSSKATCWGQLTSSNVTVRDPRSTFENIYAGRLHVCGIERGTEQTLCWGDNSHKQCEPPVGVKFQAISGGLFHTCGLTEDTHEARCWGDNSKLQLQVPNGTAFSSIAAGDWYTCGVTMDGGAIRCWGSYTGTLDSVKTNRGLCSTSCNSKEYVDNTGVCTSNEETVCLACSQGPCTESGQTEIAPCNKTSDRVCDAVNTVVPPSKTGNKQTGPNIVGIVGGVLGGLAAVAAIAGVAGYICRRRAAGASTRGDDRWDDLANRVVAFSSVELQVATRNYGEDMILGRGAFGVVYKGILSNGQVVAIKRAASPGTGSTFDKELELLGRINHVNLVNLVGYCKAERLLVFEFMENGSLYDCLFKKLDLKLRAVRRVRIALQAARGIEYLHEYSNPSIIHRDIKTANVLLDGQWNAHVSDFGLSLFGPVPGQTHLSNVTVMGTPGYLDPEYFQTLQLTSKSDVYSFGVVLLELITDRKIVIKEQGLEQEGIVSWVSNLVEENRAADAVADPSVRYDFTSCGSSLLQQILQLALDCTKPRGRDRPSMSFVARKLEELFQLLPAQASRDEAGSSDSSTALRNSDTPLLSELSGAR
ncbi:putative receptor protein kinase CRINKLY4 [Selaginella moellendorffii]|uniref:putative receptor protein kinase CRINKLY4 n=1 Tax=Selaginella moellendorffii TaxID=88036 RepID=UPI000D1C625A|nr:putative receptor protein kinase CRINKLY4 [Selaginella moellendorffii]|eukprot:XP_024540636.1 putative receptor protein kinase CRINKLY4 [Selaginella moellendorffii]